MSGVEGKNQGEVAGYTTFDATFTHKATWAFMMNEDQNDFVQDLSGHILVTWGHRLALQ